MCVCVCVLVTPPPHTRLGLAKEGSQDLAQAMLFLATYARDNRRLEDASRYAVAVAGMPWPVRPCPIPALWTIVNWLLSLFVESRACE